MQLKTCLLYDTLLIYPKDSCQKGGWAEVMCVLQASEKLLEDTLGCAIGLAFYSARKDYKIIRERFFWSV